jgi:hypothetical protein
MKNSISLFSMLGFGGDDRSPPQRADKVMGLKAERPGITQSNVVCAEPMPGEERLLSEFLNGRDSG